MIVGIFTKAILFGISDETQQHLCREKETQQFLPRVPRAEFLNEVV
jgi:hypothetical protein